MLHNHAQMDVITSKGGNLSSSGSVAQKLLQSDFNVNALRTQDILRLREWINFDAKVIEVARQRLVAVGDLMAAGLTYEVPNAMGITKIEWERFSDLGPATVSMGGLTPGQNDRFDIDLQSIPLPIIHKDFQVNIRQLTAYRQMGTPLDTTQAALASRIVSETIEAMVFNGTSVGSANNKIYGYTTFPNRVTGSVTGNWATLAGNIANAPGIITDVLAMIAALDAVNMYGPYMLYVPTAVYTAFGNDYKANSGLTILQRVKQISGIIDVRPTNNLTTTNVVLVQFTSDVVDMIDGIQPTIVQWESEGGMVVNFKVLAILIPRLKVDKNTQCGIAHFS